MLFRGLRGLSGGLLHGTGGVHAADDGVLVRDDLQTFELEVAGDHAVVDVQRGDIDVELVGEVLHEGLDLQGTGDLGELTTGLHTHRVTGDVEGDADHDRLLLVHGEEVHVEAVVIHRVPLVLVGDGGVHLTIEVEVHDVGGGGVGETHQLLLIDSKQDVVDAGAVEVAGDEALAAERLDDGLVALLADLAVQLKMLHCTLILKRVTQSSVSKTPLHQKAFRFF